VSDSQLGGFGSLAQIEIILETCNLLKLLHGEDNQHHEEWCPIAYLLETWNKAVVDMLLDCRWNEANVLLHILITIKDWYREDNKVRGHKSPEVAIAHLYYFIDSTVLGDL